MKTPNDLPDVPATVIAVLVSGESSTVEAPGDDEEIGQGDRHEALLAWGVSRLTAHGVLGRVALDAMLGHNGRVMRPPLPTDEVERLWKHLEKTRIAASERANGDGYVWSLYADDDIENPRWLWKPYVPLGKLVIVGGAPGHGKSQLTTFLAAHVTRAAFYNSDLTVPGRVILLSAEDDSRDTITPRLMASNADLRLVERVHKRRDFNGLDVQSQVVLPTDVLALQARLARGDVRLLILDPAPSFVDRSHSTLVNQDVRAVLEPLKTMAEKYRVTIVMILHLNKASEVKEFTARVAESHGFVAVARTVLALGPDPEDEEGEAGAHKVLAIAKSNLVRRAGTSVRFESTETTVDDRAGAPVTTAFLRMGELCDVTADDLLMNDDQRHAQQTAREWLHDYLGTEWRKSGDMEAAATKAGHSKRTIDRIRRQDCKRHKEAGVAHGPWWVALSTSPPFDPPKSGILGDLDAELAPTLPTMPDLGGVDRGDLAQDRQDRQTILHLDDIRRERDRRLGERWEDDE